jgi:hypothetical protein
MNSSALTCALRRSRSSHKYWKGPVHSGSDASSKAENKEVVIRGANKIAFPQALRKRKILLANVAYVEPAQLVFRPISGDRVHS